MQNMLKIYYGDLKADNYIFNPDVFFNNSYEDEWITDPFSVEMIKDIDQSDVLGAKVIDSPFLGSIPVERLSLRNTISKGLISSISRVVSICIG